MCHRYARKNEEHNRQDYYLDVIYDIIGVNGRIFSFSDLQPGDAATRIAIQGLSWAFA